MASRPTISSISSLQTGKTGKPRLLNTGKNLFGAVVQPDDFHISTVDHHIFGRIVVEFEDIFNISFSPDSMVPLSSPISTIMRISSSETSSASLLGSIPSRRKTPLVEIERNQVMGRRTTGQKTNHSKRNFDNCVRFLHGNALGHQFA